MLCLALLTCVVQAAAPDSGKYAKQVEALLARMTLDEKIGQMVQADMNAVKNKEDISRYAFGSMLSGGDSDPADISPAGWLKMCQEFQTYALKSRLRIPLIYGIDAVHGHNNVDGAVIFPHNIGLGATRNPALVRKAGAITAREVAGTGMHWAFAPCVAAAQNERWGRTYESFSESPDICGTLGAAAVEGLQQKLPGGWRLIACAKHYAGDGGTRDGIDQGDVICDEATFRRLHLSQYVPAIKAGCASIMVSYSSWNGQKMHGNKHLLTDVLKNEYGFRGVLVSDWAAIDQLSPNYKQAVEKSINAGLDMAMIPNGPGQKNSYVDFINALKELVAEGTVPQSRIDDAVRRIIRTKYEMGIFERSFANPELVGEIGSAGHREVARECVRESLVLLKNENKALPFSKKIRHLAVVGPGANDLGMQCGGWTIAWQGKTGTVTKGGTTILDAVRKTVSKGTRVTYSANGNDMGKPDAVLVVVGEQPYAEMKGDRSNLSLPAEQQDMVARARKSGAPVVTVVLSGRPLVLESAVENSDAIVAAWLPGTEGLGVTDVLFGAKPKGKLPRTWPKDNTELGLTVNTAQAGAEPLYALGHGLTW